VNPTELTPAQLMLWAGQRFAPGSPLYNSVLTFDLHGPLDRARFTAAFDRLTVACDAMRTVFREESGIVSQYVLPAAPRPLEFREAPSDSFALTEWVERHAVESFDLTTCCYRAILLRLSADRHLFLLNQHHIVLDAWGVSKQFHLLREWYGAEDAGASSTGNVPQFAHYREALTPPAKLPEYWKGRSTSIPPLLLGRTNTDASTITPRIRIPMGSGRMQALNELIERPEIRHWTRDVTRFNVFATVLSALVYRLTAESDIVIGAVSGNRATEEERRLPAQLMEVLPLYSRVEVEDTFLDLYARQRVSGNAFFSAARPGLTNPTLASSFRVVLNYLTATCGSFTPAIECTTRWHSPGHGDPHHHLRLLVHDFNGTGELTVELDLSAAVFSESERESVSRWFLRLFDALCTDPIQRPAAVKLFGPGERDRIRLLSTGPTVDYGGASVLSEIIKRIDRQPTATAISSPEETITYRELGYRSERLAARIGKHPVETSGHVGIHLPRSVELVVAILACWRAGRPYVPLPTGTGTDRLRYMINTVDCGLVLSHSRQSDELLDGRVSFLFLDRGEGDFQFSETLAPAAAPASTPAYTLFTSGTTGRPKGVTVSHAALYNYIAHAAQAYVTTPNPVFPFFTAFGFDLTITSLFTPLFVGGQLVVYPETEGGGPDLSVIDVFADDRSDVIKLTPSHLALIREQDPSLRKPCTLIVGGEQLSSSLASGILQKLPPGSRLINEYGPTEATVGCITHTHRPETDTNAAVPIGRPIANTEAWILDRSRLTVPDGVAGELYLGGRCLAEGYFGHPELSRERFVDHPFEPGKRLYRTGDRARRNREGSIEYLGRLDRQVKVRGHRVELGGIEAILNRHPAIATAAVVSDPEGEITPSGRLVAYYHPSGKVESGALRDHLSHHLPEYGIPQIFVPLEEMPLSPSGKIDYQALRALPASPFPEPVSYEAPTGEIEELLAEIWREVLAAGPIGRHDNFIQLGGHSLTAIRLVARINDAFELTVPLHHIFTSPTIALQAAYLEQTLLRLLEESENE
jgi:amino acid adenylation domain-containing protein